MVGSSRVRTPVAAKIAFAIAEATGGAWFACSTKPRVTLMNMHFDLSKSHADATAVASISMRKPSFGREEAIRSMEAGRQFPRKRARMGP
jgi:hypothetical protein